MDRNEEAFAWLRSELGALTRRVARLEAGPVVLDDDTLRRAEAAKLLGLKPSTLNRMASRREGPRFIVFRGRAYYRLEELERWRTEQQRAGAIDRPRQAATDLPLFPAAAT